jgi:hypothetical protein
MHFEFVLIFAGIIFAIWFFSQRNIANTEIETQNAGNIEIEEIRQEFLSFTEPPIVSAIQAKEKPKATTSTVIPKNNDQSIHYKHTKKITPILPILQIQAIQEIYPPKRVQAIAHPKEIVPIMPTHSVISITSI